MSIVAFGLGQVSDITVVSQDASTIQGVGDSISVFDVEIATNTTTSVDTKENVVPIEINVESDDNNFDVQII